MLQSASKDGERFLCCAYSNVGAANMFSRARSLGIRGSLIMAKSKVPSEVCVDEGCFDPTDRVVFCTVSARNSFKLKNEYFENIMLDEAAQVAEACVWGLLRQEVHCLYMSGDPDQLPALVSQAGEELQYGRSMMRRLIDIGVEPELLNVQRRMHPDIVEYPNREFYGGKLLTEYSGSPFDAKALEYIRVEGQEKAVGTSFTNPEEVTVVQKIVSELQGEIKDVVVICPYAAQLNLLKKCLPRTVPVHTVDSFQGREADAIVLSTVRSGKNIGFWKDYRRVNVAFTRAKHVFRVVGNVFG